MIIPVCDDIAYIRNTDILNNVLIYAILFKKAVKFGHDCKEFEYSDHDLKRNYWKN